MQASYRNITPGFVPKIKIIHNHLIVKIDDSKRTAAKYKKVGKQTKQHLLNAVARGCSIISIAQALRINYSTAKSIVQMQKSKCISKSRSHSIGQGDIQVREQKPLSQSRDDQLPLLGA